MDGAIFFDTHDTPALRAAYRIRRCSGTPARLCKGEASAMLRQRLRDALLNLASCGRGIDENGDL
jgi:hypothetical protein